jgi:S-adenosylmethionine:tRNA ribosyltransferase-isomerase
MDIALFDFILPERHIALRPAEPRESAKLLLAQGSAIADHLVGDLPDILRPDDILVVNDTKVIPAQLTGRRGEATIGTTLHKRIDLRRWQAFVRNGKRLRLDDIVDFGHDVAARVEERHADGSFTLAFLGEEPVEALLLRAGNMPLPPYIASKREIDERDAQDYQTIFADRQGAVAAPTASLHFTPELLERIAQRGVTMETVTLHVGAGTFLPVKAQDTNDHVMHAEWGEIAPDVAQRLRAAKAAGRRIIGVGTTSLRLLESAVDSDGLIQPFVGDTGL